MLDEIKLRRPEFSEGRKARLGDSQEWTFPRPRLRLLPIRDPGGKVGLRPDQTYDAEYTSLRDKIFECPDGETFEILGYQMQIACYLLLKNYDLSDDQLSKLIYFDFGDPANIAMWDDLVDILYAVLPKLIASGSESA